MTNYGRPTKPTSPSEWAIIAWVLILGSLVVGLGCVGLAYRYAAERPVAADAFRNLGLGLIAISALGYGATWAARRFLD